tara:strand:+ start:213 stop:635 length:423 start_codon:yes stop_codon:yes gene_type:complete
MKNVLTYDIVLLVDDDSVINLVHRHIITKAGIAKEIKVFLNPLDAFMELQRNLSIPKRKILVLLDINMPEMDGFEFLDKAASLVNKEKVFDMLMVTSSIDYGDMAKGSRHPLVNRYITKPLKYNEIINFVLSRTANSIQS